MFQVFLVKNPVFLLHPTEIFGGFCVCKMPHLTGIVCIMPVNLNTFD